MRCLFTLLLLCSFLMAQGQQGQLAWGKTYSAPIIGNSKIITDAQDNVYFLFANAANTTIGSTVHGAVNGIVVKYDAQGNLLWSRSAAGATLVSINLAEDSLDLLVCGYVNNSSGVNLGNGIVSGTGVYAAGLLWKLNGQNGNSIWARNFNIQASNDYQNGINTRITQVDASPAGIFTISTYVNTNTIRKHDLQGNLVWSKTVFSNGSAYTLATLRHWVDTDGVSFYQGGADNANATSVTLNGVNYPVDATVSKFMFALDSSGNTLWIRRNVNLNCLPTTTVAPNGDITILGKQIYYNQDNQNPFNPGFCNTSNTFIKGNIKTGKLIWERKGLGDLSYEMSVAGAATIHQISMNNSVWPPFATAAGTFRPAAEKAFLHFVFDDNGTPLRGSTLFHYTGTLNWSDVKASAVNKAGQVIMLMRNPNNGANFQFANGTLPGVSTAELALLVVNPQPAPARYQQTTWTGAVSGEWFAAGNWTNGIPQDSSTVTIPAGATNYPTTDNNFYNFTTNKWAACGTLIVQPNVNYLFGYGARINQGLLVNNGTVRYNYVAGYSSPSFDGWGASEWQGNGLVRLTGNDGNIFNYTRMGNVRLELSLATANATLKADCLMVDSLILTQGSIVPRYGGGSSGLSVQRGIRRASTTTNYVGLPIRQRLVAGSPMVLPLGTSSGAQPAVIILSNPSRIGYVTASFSSPLTGAAPATNINGVAVASALNGGMWTITPDTTLEAGNSYSLTAYLRGSTNTSNVANYGLIKRSNSSTTWAQAGNHVPARDSGGYVIAAATGITGFSDYAVGIAAASLPFQELKLAGFVQGNDHQLRWSVLASDVTEMTIEKSADGHRFETLVQQPFAPQGSYTEKDVRALVQFYRLKLTDRLNAVAYSNTVRLAIGQTVKAQIFPTHIQDQLTVQLPAGTQAQLRMLDAQGRQLFAANNLQGLQQLRLPTLSAGSYRCVLLSDKGEILLSTTLVKE